MKLVKVALDCDIPEPLAPMLNAAFGSRGFDFIHVSKIVPPGTTDEVWADTFKRFGGEITVSADKNIIKKPHKALAFTENGFKAFFMQPTWSNAPGRVKLAHIIYWWPEMSALADRSVDANSWQVPFEYRNNALTLQAAEFKVLRVPDHILDGVREERRRN